MTNEQVKAEIMQIYGVLSPSKQQALDMAIKALEQESKTGHWIDQYNDGDWHCSKCGAIVEKDEQTNHNWYFCYHCGAKMVEPQESEVNNEQQIS